MAFMGVPATGWSMGLILLIAGRLKVTDMELFIGQIRDYGIISQRIVLTLSTWGLIALECALGVGLLVFYRPRFILSLTAMLVLFFWGRLLGPGGPVQQ